jgi:hypothetical protein
MRMVKCKIANGQTGDWLDGLIDADKVEALVGLSDNRVHLYMVSYDGIVQGTLEEVAAKIQPTDEQRATEAIEQLRNRAGVWSGQQSCVGVQVHHVGMTSSRTKHSRAQPKADKPNVVEHPPEQ